MKRLVVVAVVLLLATAVGAAVLVQQGYYDLNNLNFANLPTQTKDQTAKGEKTVVSASATATPGRTEPTESSQTEAKTETKKVAAVSPSPSPANTSQTSTQQTSTDGLVFDIARIQPDGVSVFAGQGKPRQFVRVLADGELVGTAKVDDNGEWVLITERKLASNDPELSLEVGEAPAETTASADSNSTQVAAAGDTSSGSDASKQKPGLLKTGQTARDVNEKMLNDLQRLVDDARRSENSAKREQAGTSAGEQAEALLGNSVPVSDNAPAASKAGEPTREAGATERPSDTSKAEATKLAATSDDRPARSSTSVTEDKTIPIPIHFVYREASFTPDGEKAADLLLEYLKHRKLNTVTLSGHADERGTPDLNMELSMDRLKTVESYLRAGGFTGELLLLPKGKTEPFTGVDRSNFPQEDLYQLDRRVELRLAN